MNETYQVYTEVDCSMRINQIMRGDPVLRVNWLGCQLLNMLLDMYHLNVTYVFSDTNNDTVRTPWVDISTMPRPLTSEFNFDMYPIFAIISRRRYGFILRRNLDSIDPTFYRQPFRRSVWNALYVMLLLNSLLFYWLHRWEKTIISKRYSQTECSFWNEFLIAIGAYCQRVPCLDVQLWSRRITYVAFFNFSFIIYCYYNSNLLSRLVNNRDRYMTLHTLMQSNYKIAIHGNILRAISEYNQLIVDELNRNFLTMKTLDLTNTIIAIHSDNTAVFTDFITLYPYIRKWYDDEAICNLVEVPMFDNIKKYLFTSHDFPYKEQFKIGSLRAKEAGLTGRLMSNVTYASPPCNTPPHTVPSIYVMIYPFILLSTAFGLSLIILGFEILHHRYIMKRHPPLPFLN